MDNSTSRVDKTIEKVLINEGFFNNFPTGITHTLPTDAYYKNIIIIL